ncbi:DUF4411 family protein [Hyphomonas sp.]|uniref:DUF4411 family protein n=1 Tax=Hyphomonas sp. TaxID=87 RepID=UPI00326539D0
MPRYVLDTSWISNPVMELPQDIHVSLWQRVGGLLESGVFCWNQEIWEELDGSIYGDVADSLQVCQDNGGCFELGQDHWDWDKYIWHVGDIRSRYRDYISEYNSNRKSTIGVNDCSIVCLAKTLGLPVASMEKRNANPSPVRMRIPELCEREGIEHFDLNKLLRAEGIRV